MEFTGKIGSLIDISGNGFSRISRVLFSEAKSNFSVLNDNLIKARVPEEVAWDYVKIISDERNTTGTSSQKFAPEPLIQDYYPSSGVYGDTITITGLAFSGVSKVTFNGLEASYSVNNNYYISATVPSGNTRGDLVVHGQSGLSNTAVKSFEPQILVTGFSPTSGVTGVSINIYGKYFFDELMYTGNQSGKYLVSYGKNLYSGYVEKISDTHLSGNIPESLLDGGISVAANNSAESQVNFYEKSAAQFDVLALGLPTINSVGTITGFYSSYYGNQPIIFGTQNVGTDTNGKGLSLALIKAGQTGIFLSGTSGLSQITSLNSDSFIYIKDGEISDQAKASPEVFGGAGEFNFYEDAYDPSAGLTVSPPFTVPVFSANPETAGTDDFQALASPTEAALPPGEYYIAVEMNQLAAYGLESSRAISSNKVKILSSIASKSIGYGSSVAEFEQTANSTVQTIDGHKYVINYDSSGAVVSTGIYGTPGVDSTVVSSLPASWKGFN